MNFLISYSYRIFSDSAKYRESVSFPVSSFLSVSQNFVETVETELQSFRLSVLRDTEAYIDWCKMFKYKFAKLLLVKLIVDMRQSLEHFIEGCCMCLFNNHVRCK